MLLIVCFVRVPAPGAPRVGGSSVVHAAGRHVGDVLHHLRDAHVTIMVVAILHQKRRSAAVSIVALVWAGLVVHGLRHGDFVQSGCPETDAQVLADRFLGSHQEIRCWPQAGC